ncbi:MAG: hypothetical protein HFG60_12160 [Lachnospiraceae bacterium]|nr:hypothetical protein [Lachnospiraceae bacterium]MCI9185287.1 hypothetical protein [Lachnospiraceae bacterium]
MMKHRASLTLLLTISCLLFSAFPAIAGEWKQTEDEQWQYIQDNGEKATGWLELEDGLYYLDEDGNRYSGRWVKDNGAWYYLDEDGLLVKDGWVDNYYVGEDGKLEKKR